MHRMLHALRGTRSAVAFVLSLVFALGLLLGTPGAGEAAAHVEEVADAVAEHHGHGGHDHHAPAGDSRPAEPEHHGDHDCTGCVCFAAPGACSVPVLSGTVAGLSVTPAPQRAAAPAPPAAAGSDPPFDIFHPPRL